MRTSSLVPQYDVNYEHHGGAVHAKVRREAFGEDIGQNSWITAEEFRRFIGWLDLGPSSEVLDIASGSGGPSLFLARIAGCRVTGIELNQHGIRNASRLAAEQGFEAQVAFQEVDASAALPFGDERFDAVICIDAINHLRHRPQVLAEWRRVLKIGGRLLFTDPIIVTGPLDSEEIAIRSSIGYFIFAPAGLDERMVREAGLELVRAEDVTESVTQVARRRREARARYRDELVVLEGERSFEGQQSFLRMAERLAAERRLSRFVFVSRR
jgi:SAM-dependent methyltransferase